MYNTGVGLWHFFQLGSPFFGLIDIYIQRYSKAKYPKLQVHKSFNIHHSYHHVREVWCVSEFLLFDWQTQWYTHIDHTQGALARPVARKQMTKSQSWRILCPPTPLLWHVCSLFAAHSRSQRDVLVSLDQPLIHSPWQNCVLTQTVDCVTQSLWWQHGSPEGVAMLQGWLAHLGDVLSRILDRLQSWWWDAGSEVERCTTCVGATTVARP